MGRNKLVARRRDRQNAKKKRAVTSLTGNLAYAFLAVAILFFAVVVFVAAHHASAGTNESDAADAQAAATVDAGSGWIHITSDSPDAIIAAAHKTTLFNVNRSSDGDYLDISRLETPILVRALSTTGSIVMPDYYVIPIDNAAGEIAGAAELALNSTHTAIQLTSIITYSSPRPHGEVARVRLSAAQADLSSQHHVMLRSGAEAQLIYVPIDATALESGEITWNGGGLYPADPIWLIPGADGEDHVVGVDGQAYNASSVPIMKQP
jgi:hypothetical protein